MTEEAYIKQVKDILASINALNYKVAEICNLTVPENANPLLVLIHGDSELLEDDIAYIKENEEASEDELVRIEQDLSSRIINKIQKYTDDWDANNRYYYEFSLRARYGVLRNGGPAASEYVTIDKEAVAKTVHDAAKSAKDWEKQLRKEITLYVDQETVHTQISVMPIYTIYDSRTQKIAAGFLAYDNEKGISTWLNQL